MPKATLGGHPLHPMLIVVPAGLIPFGLVLDAMYRATGKESYTNAAYYSLVGGLLGGVAAGAAGAMDYMTIEPQTEVKQTANVHAALNGGALALTAVNVLARKNKPDHRGGSLVLSALATLGVAVSGWFGARMVYEQGMRVKGVSPVAHAPELKLPGDERIHHALMQAEQMATSKGSVLH
jgi:uncharacterized membrane protein